MTSTTPSPTGADSGSGQIGMAAAVSIGIGGMVGAGIFSILGVVAQAAGNAMWLAFAIGGVVALFSTYSYARLGATFPSAGGAVHFLVKSFGDGVLAGGLNLFMWAGYIISLALYATAFGSYAATFITTMPSPLLVKSLALGAVLVLTVVNAFGARAMGRWETVIVAVKVAILVLFAGAGLFFVKADNLSPALWPEAAAILFGAGVLFIGYEGFGLVTNAARDMRDPKTMLPRALYASVILVIVIYLAVSITVSGNLTDAQIERARDYALAEAAKPFLGEFGFRLIAIAALFSTASAINATLFGLPMSAT
jgi:amino acid transporter